MGELYDAVIVGGGPAGLTAALYLARARQRVAVIERGQFGGQIATTREVVNYPGVERADGRVLAETMRRQAERFGAECVQAGVTGLVLDGTVKTVRTDRGEFRCLGLLVATGAYPRRAGFRGEEEHIGRGVAYCATCDGEFFAGRDVFVIGGGYAAAEESVFLTRYARSVTILIRRDGFSCAAAVAEEAAREAKIRVLTNTVMQEVSGGNAVTYVRYQNTRTGEVTELRRGEDDSFGVFVLAGRAPETELLRGAADLDERGYIMTDATGKTSVDGVYAAGDVCAKPLRQVVTATGDGAVAAMAMEKHIAELRQETGLRAAPQPGTATPSAAAAPDDRLFTGEMRAQLEELFSRMERPLLLRVATDERDVSRELRRFADALAALTDKLRTEEDGQPGEDAPCVRICRDDGTDTGLAFHGVPGGHEFTSFALALYNAAGPGQPISPDERERLAALRRPVELMLLVTLSCGVCPELVTAAQRLAAESPLVSAHVYDLRHFEGLQKRYRVMSVPCMVVNGEKTYFGRKSTGELLDILEAAQ